MRRTRPAHGTRRPRPGCPIGHTLDFGIAKLVQEQAGSEASTPITPAMLAQMHAAEIDCATPALTHRGALPSAFVAPRSPCNCTISRAQANRSALYGVPPSMRRTASALMLAAVPQAR